MPSPVADLARVTPTAWSHRPFLTCFSRGSGGRAPKNGGLSQAGDTRATEANPRACGYTWACCPRPCCPPTCELCLGHHFAPRETLCGTGTQGLPGSHGSSSRPVVQPRLTTAHQAPCPVVRPDPHGASCSPPCLVQPAQASPEPPPWPSSCPGHLPPELHPHNCLLQPHPMLWAPPLPLTRTHRHRLPGPQLLVPLGLVNALPPPLPSPHQNTPSRALGTLFSPD